MAGPGQRDSLLHRYLGDRRFALCLPRALAFQILHPGIAAGLVQHAPNRLWEHKKRTVSQMVYMAYSERDMRSVIQFGHEHVKGRDEWGARYHALQPEIFFFQHATYVDTLMTSVDIFHRPLSEHDRERLYHECCEWYLRHGISARAMPQTWPEFVTYFENACAGLRFGADAAALAPQVLRPDTWIPRRLPTPAVRALIAAPARELLGVDLHRGDRFALRRCAATTRSRMALLPARMRCLPQARTAHGMTTARATPAPQRC